MLNIGKMDTSSPIQRVTMQFPAKIPIESLYEQFGYVEDIQLQGVHPLKNPMMDYNEKQEGCRTGLLLAYSEKTGSYAGMLPYEDQLQQAGQMERFNELGFYVVFRDDACDIIQDLSNPSYAVGVMFYCITPIVEQYGEQGSIESLSLDSDLNITSIVDGASGMNGYGMSGYGLGYAPSPVQYIPVSPMMTTQQFYPASSVGMTTPYIYGLGLGNTPQPETWDQFFTKVGDVAATVALGAAALAKLVIVVAGATITAKVILVAGLIGGIGWFGYRLYKYFKPTFDAVSGAITTTSKGIGKGFLSGFKNQPLPKDAKAAETVGHVIGKTSKFMVDATKIGLEGIKQIAAAAEKAKQTFEKYGRYILIGLGVTGTVLFGALLYRRLQQRN